MSHHPLIPAKPAEITLETLPQLFGHWRCRAGGMTMTQTPPEPGQPADDGQGGNNPPERPTDIPEGDWNSLGDAGKQVIVREREARQAAERALAAARAKPAPPKKAADTPPAPGGQATKVEPPKPDAGGQIDIAAIVQQAVEAAVKPFADREEQRETLQAADRVQTAVLEAAKPLLHDATDALAGIDLTSVVNDQGVADPEKVKTALADLVTRKPHLAKSPERKAPIGIGGGLPAGATDAEKVKAVLADMQRATGVRIPAAPGTTN
jgi:hypothetical protein